MYAQSELVAQPCFVQDLWRASEIITSEIRALLPGAECVAAGSLVQGDALSLRWRPGLDLDLFVILRKRPKKLGCLFEGIIQRLKEYCASHSWIFTPRATSLRISLSENFTTWIDVSFVVRRPKYDELQTLAGHPAVETYALRSKPRDYMQNAILCQTWLNLKLWNHRLVPKRMRPNSHTLQIIFFEAIPSINADLDNSWQALTHILGEMIARVEHLEPKRMAQKQDTIPTWATSILQDLAVFLRQYSDAVRAMTVKEHRQWLLEHSADERRVQVFISSRQREFSRLRKRFSEQKLDGVEFLLAEDFFPWTRYVENGMEICECHIATSDVFVGIYGTEYGGVSPNRSASPIEEELEYARSQTPDRPILLFSREGAHREAQLDEMLRQSLAGGTITLSEDDGVAFDQIAAEISAAVGQYRAA